MKLSERIERDVRQDANDVSPARYLETREGMLTEVRKLESALASLRSARVTNYCQGCERLARKLATAEAYARAAYDGETAAVQGAMDSEDCAIEQRKRAEAAEAKLATLAEAARRYLHTNRSRLSSRTRDALDAALAACEVKP